MKNLIEKINKLKKERNAIILAHNYQPAEIQDIADFVGDSLELAQKVINVKARVIVFCGVRFMAETAAILNLNKIILMPDSSAGCPMAEMIKAKKVRQLKKKYPDAAVVCYVNSTAEVKAESDICCTSSNALKVVNSLRNYKRVIFIPDKYLGHFASIASDKEFILYNGFCPVHTKISKADINELKKKYPKAKIIVHPECRAPIQELADKVLSTGGMREYALNSKTKEFIIGTENGMLYKMKKESPNKKFYPVSSSIICPDMKKNTLPKILNCLENLEEQVRVPE
ncbi:quinolinate synthetase, partial [Parcubacteria bacterium DG_74_2]